jgi:hypothetical protein
MRKVKVTRFYPSGAIQDLRTYDVKDEREAMAADSAIHTERFRGAMPFGVFENPAFMKKDLPAAPIIRDVRWSEETKRVEIFIINGRVGYIQKERTRLGTRTVGVVTDEFFILRKVEKTGANYWAVTRESGEEAK